MLIARVAIPRPNVDETWDYIVPADLAHKLDVGMRVLVPVGGARITGYVTGLGEKSTTSRNLKPVVDILDQEPLVSPEILELTRWASGYYINSWGEMLKAALPAGINVEEKEVLRVSARGREELKRLRGIELIDDDAGAERDLLDYLCEAGKEKASLLQKKFPARIVGALLRREWIERATARSGRALERTMKAVEAVGDPPEVEDSFWKRSPKRLEALEKLREIGEPVLVSESEEKLGVSSAVLDGLVKHGLARYSMTAIRRDPFRDLDVEHAKPHILSGEQVGVYERIVHEIGSDDPTPFLLHGVTGSGKTEVYIHAAMRCLEQGRGVLILIPELALTPQFVRRYYAVFGEKLAVLHSALGQGERTDEWNRVRRGEASVVLGTRLSVFSPVRRLGLLVVDEEHDASYKQDEYPTFNARDLALVRSKNEKAVCVLGSATPSLESLHNALADKYELLRLKKRVQDRPLPVVNPVDLRDQEQRHELSQLPQQVHQAIEATIERNEQVLVLVARKGYSPFVICRACGYRFECGTCSITMSYHEKLKRLKCHYCGKTREMPQICPECGSTSVEALGVGSEKVEENLKTAFPTANIARMDRDVITRPHQYNELLERLRTREIDILVGTQMLAKGHDYHGVTTVVAMGLDLILGLPDFRHSERIFQLILQISGRAGRGERSGDVYIMTYKPDHYAVRAACESDWDSFLAREFEYRKRLRYPPFGFLALVTIEDFDKARGRASAQAVLESLHEALEDKAFILGPSLAPYARLKNRWRHQVMIKAASRAALGEALRRVKSEFRGPGQMRISIDPVSVM